MRSRSLLLVGVAASALVAVTSYAPTATAGHPTKTALICNMSDQTSAGTGINSQRYPPSSATFTDMGASDFMVPASGCTINQVNVIGRYVGGAGLATKVRVQIRTGVNIPNGPNLAPAVDNAISPTGDNGFGSFNTILPGPVTLAPGHYWLIFQAKLNPINGQWIWDMTTFGTFKPDKWRNPGGGWGCGTTWITAGATPCFNIPAKSFIFQIIQ